MAEIAQLLNIPAGTVKSQLARGRKLLKNKLDFGDSTQGKGGADYENSSSV